MHKAQGASFLGLVVYSKKSSEEEKHKQKSEIQVIILCTIQSEVYWRVYCTTNKKMTSNIPF